jgi:hypothetical protein
LVPISRPYAAVCAQDAVGRNMLGRANIGAVSTFGPPGDQTVVMV